MNHRYYYPPRLKQKRVVADQVFKPISKPKLYKKLKAMT